MHSSVCRLSDKGKEIVLGVTSFAGYIRLIESSRGKQ